MESKEFLLKAREYGFKNFQLLKIHTYQEEIECLNDKIVSDEISDITTYSYKGEIYNKTVKASSEYLDEANLLELKEIASITDSNYQDIYLDDVNDIKILEDTTKVDLTNFKEKMLKLNDFKNKYPLLANITSILNYSSSYVEIMDLNDVVRQRQSITYEFYNDVMVTENDKTGTASYSVVTTKLDDIDIFENSEKIIDEAYLHLNDLNIDTGLYDVILDNNVVSKILNKFITTLDGDLIKKEKSCMLSKLNKKIFNNIITIKEEPLNKNLPGYVTFDNEGVDTKNKIIVDNGVLKTYLYNNKSALDNNVVSTGNNFGVTTCRNMYLEKGNKTFDELVKEMNNGLIVSDYMGSSGSAIDVLTGNISIQIIGLIVRDGKIVSGYVPCILSSSIFEIFQNVKDISNDIKFQSKICGAPAILVSNVNIAGN